MKNEDFYQLLNDGSRLAKVFALNMPLLTNLSILAAHNIDSWRIEGCDIIMDIIRWIPVEDNMDLPWPLHGFDHGSRTCTYTPWLVHGSAEVKGILSGKLIHRNDVCELSIPFAVWGGVKKGLYDYQGTRETHGSLRRFLFPNVRERSAQPMVLDYIAEDKDLQGRVRPFVSIAFTNFPELKRRLVKYAAENGMDLLDWKSIPVGAEAWKYKRGELIFRSNMWLVPISLLIDIARITVIGKKPAMWKNGSCTIEKQELYYQYLLDHAAMIVPQEAIRDEGKIGTIDCNHPVFQLLMNDAAEALHGKTIGRYGNRI